MANTDTTPLRNKLAERANGGEVAKADDRPPFTLVVQSAIERQDTAFREMLPKMVDPDRFMRIVITSVNSTPDLRRCFETVKGENSVLIAAMQAAAVGLEPDTPMKECWLLPRHNKQRDGSKVWEAQLSIGYRGLLKLAYRSGQIADISAQVVRADEHFRLERGLDVDVFEHPDAGEGEGDLTYVYAIARFKDGRPAKWVKLNRRQVEKRRAMSESWKSQTARPYSPWTKWPEEMWQKTAIRVLCWVLELSPDVQQAIASDEAPLQLNDGVIEALPYQDTAGEIEAPEPPRQGDDKVLIRAAPADVDPETGEIEPAGMESVIKSPPESGPSEDYVEATATADPPPPAAPRVDDALGAAPVDRPTTQANRKLFACLNTVGILGDDDRHEYASATLGRPVTTFKDLSVADTDRLITKLEALPATKDQLEDLAAGLRDGGILGPQRFSWSGARISRSIRNFADLTCGEVSTILFELERITKPSDGGDAA